jgi:hypothetical protein
MLSEYHSATVHRAGQVAQETADALCDDINKGRDAQSSLAIWNGANIIIYSPGKPQVIAAPGNWIVIMPDGSLAVHADADFRANYISK